MILVVAIDDRMGMLFNHRRQSQDRLLREDLLQTVGKSRLWVSPYTANQFAKEQDSRICEENSFFEKAGAGEYCFLEDPEDLTDMSRVEELIIYRWNRVYPSDRTLPIDLKNWFLTHTSEFTGHSHEKITKEVYSR